MFRSTLIVAATAIFLMSGPARAIELPSVATQDLEPALNGAVSANGLFPTQAMEEAFTDYLRWVKEQGLSRLVVFEPLVTEGYPASGQLPHQDMEDQFLAYMRWVETEGLSPFYAFGVTNFD